MRAVAHLSGVVLVGSDHDMWVSEFRLFQRAIYCEGIKDVCCCVFLCTPAFALAQEPEACWIFASSDEDVTLPGENAICEEGYRT